MSAMLAGLEDGSLKAIGMLFIACIALGSHNLTRDAIVETKDPPATLVKIAGIILALGALAAYTLGQVRDCSEADYFRIGCEVVDAIPVTVAARWEAFAYTVIFLSVPASLGVRDGIRRRDGPA